MAGTIVAKIKRLPGKLYYVDGKGAVRCVAMKRRKKGRK